MPKNIEQKSPEPNSALTLITRWEQAREEGVLLSLEEVCQNQMHLMEEVREGLIKLGFNPDESQSVASTKPEEKNQSTLEYSVQLAAKLGKLAAGSHPNEVGSYRIVRVLGEGGMGTVFAADDPTLSRQVAIKMMKPMLAQMPLAKERFLREARMAASLSHDNILPILHIGEHQNQPYLVMPLLKGETLEARLQRGPLSLPEWRQLGIETCQGLVCAHAKQMIHRDIKPSNIWLETMSENSWRVKLLDFGLARSVSGSDQMTMSGALVGTPAYMSPEQVNQKTLDARSDLFSLGVVLYESLTGISPFKRETLTATFRAIDEHIPEALVKRVTEVPTELSTLVQRMLAKDPEHRPDSLEVLERFREAVKRATPDNHQKQEVRVQYINSITGGWHWILGGIVALLIVGLVWLLQPTSGTIAATSLETHSTQAARSTGTVTRFKGTIDFKLLHIDDKGNESWLPLNDPRTLPLHIGDEFTIDGTIDPEAYVYLFWIDTQGKVDPVYPWEKPGEWGTRPAQEKPVQGKLTQLPNMVFRIAGNDSGLESVILLAKYGSPLNLDDDGLKKLFADLPAQPMLTGRPQARLWFENYKLITNDVHRGPDWRGEPTKTPIYQLQQRLAEKLGKEVDYSLSVSFTKLGKKRE